MPIPALPDWLPWWGPIVVLVPALLWGLAFLFMPFAVFGVKGRLEAIEARLDEIQGEIRSLALRMPEPVNLTQYDEAIYSPPGAGSARGRGEAVISRPPIPPATRYSDDDEFGTDGRTRRPDGLRGPRRDRQEPRADPRLDRLR
jgi:hypothetical protein